MRTFRQALFVLPGTERATCFQLSFCPWIATAWIKRLSSSADQGLPTTLSAMTYGAARDDECKKTVSRALISPLLWGSTTNSHGRSSSAAFEPPCLSSKATHLARTMALCRLQLMPLDSRHSPLRRNHAWSHSNRHRLFHTQPQMYSQKYATLVAHFEPQILKRSVTGPFEANLAYHSTHGYADEREHHL